MDNALVGQRVKSKRTQKERGQQLKRKKNSARTGLSKGREEVGKGRVGANKGGDSAKGRLCR